tara:strand:- start:3382 stop:3543 length:162 start_codon:yes stop_codon:yes gene_type:complete
MNKLRRSLLKLSILNLLFTVISKKSFSFEMKDKENKSYKKKINGFVWYLNQKD